MQYNAVEYSLQYKMYNETYNNHPIKVSEAVVCGRVVVLYGIIKEAD